MNVTNKTRKMTIIAMMSALSIVLYFIAEIPIIPMAPHLKIDLSDIPALIAAIITGPVGGIAVEFIKNVIHIFRTPTFALGELANFVVGVAVILPVSIVYNKMKYRSKVKGLIIGSILSVISIVVFGLGINALIYPLFMKLMGNPIDSAAVLWAYLISTVTMNLIKAVVTIAPVLLLLKPIEKYSMVHRADRTKKNNSQLSD